MTVQDILEQLKDSADDANKKVLMKHGIVEPLYGVKIDVLKKIAKKVKNGYELSLELFDTGIYDAMYLAGLLTEPGKVSEADLEQWAMKANAPVLREYTVAWVAAESKHGLKMAQKWIESTDDAIASIGWATLSNIVSITGDDALDIVLLKRLLERVAQTIHSCSNRVKAAMNGFVIAVGTYVQPLHQLAKETGVAIGKVKVDVGDTACKIPFSPDYIAKAESKNAIGKKRKSARCL